MHFGVVLRYVGIVVLLNTLFMFISAMVSLFNGMDSGFYPLMLSALLSAVMGAFPMIFVSKREKISNKEGYAIVILSWLVCCAVGMFPYLLWGGEFDFATAWFEIVSGYTTTGSTALMDIEALPNGLLFWRSSTHWIGGVGVVVFALIALSSGGTTKTKLSNLEMSSLAKDNYRYRTPKIIRILIVVYLGMTALQTVLLWGAGMSWFDAINHSFATIATGGFSTKNLSIAYYDNIWIEGITTVFMVLSGLHFGLIFATIIGKTENFFRSEICRFYIAVLVIATVTVSISIWDAGVYPDLFTAFRYASFQVATVFTTTGFATADTTQWTPFAMIVIIMLSIQGACAGSTSGAMKTDRVWLAIKGVKAQILQQQHPNAIIRIKMNNVTLDPSVVNYAMLFIVTYLAILMIGTIVVCATGVDLITSSSLIVACMGNVGPGFGEVGSMSNYAGLSSFVKIFSTLFMLLGRLEIFGLIQLFIIKWWK